MARIGLVFGGRSVEHTVSLSSARTVDEGLRTAGHDVVPLPIGPDGCWLPPTVGRTALNDPATRRLEATGDPVAASLRHLTDAEVDVLFPIVHGTWGEDGTLQGLAEMLDVPYVGTGVATSAVAMDKRVCKQVLQAQGLPVVDWEAVSRSDFVRDPEATLARLGRFATPLFVKPAIGGSSVGVTRVDDHDGLRPSIEHGLRFDDHLVVEKGVVGRELECAVLGHREIEASVIGEIRPGKDFYDFADKYIDDSAELIAPAPLDDAMTDRLRGMSIAAFAAIGGWGMSRVDFLLGDDGELAINEINTLPGFTAISMYPRLWALTGIALPELVDRLVEIACARHADRRRLDEGIKGWIASLGER